VHQIRKRVTHEIVDNPTLYPMKFNLETALEILSRTPQVLHSQLAGLSEEWVTGREGPGTWSPQEVIGHLIVNEETNFLSRVRLILSDAEPKIVTPINMTIHLERSRGITITDLLSEFKELRLRNLETLRSFNLTEADYAKTATHPKVGIVSLSHVLSIWVAHDLMHIGQITRVMARQYQQEIGPFLEFLPRLR
jgi:hypothetical protein